MTTPTSSSRPTSLSLYYSTQQLNAQVAAMDTARAAQKANTAALQSKMNSAGSALSSAQASVLTATTGVIAATNAAQAAAAAYNAAVASGTATPSYLTLLNSQVQGAITNLKTAQNVLNSANSSLTTAKTAFLSASTAYNKSIGVTTSNTSTSTSTSTSTTTTTTTTPPPTATPTYITNIPMVKEAYLKPLGPQGTSLVDSSTVVGNLSKGRLLMSTLFPDVKSAVQLTAGTKTDPALYGFKVLYNPPSVDMSWGPALDVNPYWLATGHNQSSMPNLNSTISFTLFLNRSLDMNYVDANGFSALTNVVNPTGGYVPGGRGVPTFNPWPTSAIPSNADLTTIYQRGTMYDLEFLFKITGGPAISYTSPLMGITTADRGWLNPLPVELYLSDGLHYLVRILSMDVTHTMFNERMIPTMSQVTLTCGRYFDNVTASQLSASTTALFGKA